MEPKLKAAQLFEKFKEHAHMDWDEYHGYDHDQGVENAKQCALIAVEVALEDATQNTVKHGRGGLTNYDYWNEVKIEIESL